MNVFYALIIINCCVIGNGIAMQQNATKDLKDSLRVLAEKLNILENILISEKKTARVIRDQSEIYKDIQKWAHEFDQFEFIFFGDLAILTADLEHIEANYPGQKLNTVFDDLEKPLNEILLSLQSINHSIIEKNNVEALFMPNKFETPKELKEVSLHYSTTFKLTQFLKFIRQLKETIFKKGLPVNEISRFDRAVEKIWETVSKILEELKKLEVDYKPVEPASCLIS